jgi:AraC-like DNA-binding protein
MMASIDTGNPGDGPQAANRFSIRHQGPAKGLAYETWLEGICRGFCRLDVGPADDELIDCHNEFTQLHSIAMATPRGASARFARTRDLLRDGCDDFVLISASHGTVRVTQQAKTIDLSAGQMCLTEMNVVGAADLSSAGGFTTTRIPRRALLHVSPAAETQLARPIGHNPGLGAMVDRYFGLCNDVAGDLDAVGQKAAAQHMVDLIGLLIGADGERADAAMRRGGAAAQLDLLKSDILRRLPRPDLSIDGVARANGLSVRQAQRLFARSGATFSEFVLEQRLALARRLLLDASSWRKISDIAYAAGFSDLSYFNRTFRKRFGLTPSDLARDAAAHALD